LTFTATAIAVCSYVSFFVNYSKYTNKLILHIINVSGGIIAILSLTPFLVKDLTPVLGTSYPSVVFGNLAIIYILFVVLSVGFIIYLIIKLRKEIKGLEYLQISYITTGMILAGIIAIFTNIILPITTGNSSSAFWGPVAVSIISAITTYTITRHRLFGLKYLVSRLFYFLVLNFLAFVLFIMTLTLFSTWNLEITEPLTYIIGILISFIFTLLYSFSKNFLDNKFHFQLGSSEENIEDIKEKFLKDISTELDINKLGILTLKTMDKIFDLKKSGVIIFNTDNASIIYKKLYEFEDHPIDNHDLLQVIYYWDEIGHSTILTKDELSNTSTLNKQEKRILRFMNKDNIEIILPLNRKVHLNGVVILGKKNNRNPFTVEDIKYLESLIINSSVAFSRSILYNQVQDLNSSLQQKVNEQTKELQQKIKELEEARRKEADMIDIMGHELRTPMSVVKLNTDLLHNFTHNVERRQKDYKKYVKRIKDAVETEIKLINTLLSSAKLEGDKIELNPEKVDLTEQIKMVLHAQEGRAKKKGIKLITKFNTEKSYIFADHARVVEVLSNLIDNAVKYTPKGSVTVTTEDDGIYTKISIIDTGLGMTEEDMKYLGKKFFRTGNYTQSELSDDIDIVRPGGTGLGLYVTFNLIRKMGGEIHVESEVGKGSNFTFTLPKYNGQESTPISDSKDMFRRLGLRE
jgi:signal transduction histidine kinase